MDILDFTPQEDTIEITLKYKGEVLLNDGDDTPMTITVYLPHSKEAKAVEHEIANRQIKTFQKKKSMEFDAAQLEQQSIERLAKLTKEWDVTFGGEKPKLTVDKAKELYEKAFWLRSLIEMEVEEAMDFTQD